MNWIDRVRSHLMKGLVIPAHPLALTQKRRLDERRQRALTRYYLAAGAGGVAVGVHTTQFEIHRPTVGLYRPVLTLAAEELKKHSISAGRAAVSVAGIVGKTKQAAREAAIARELNYDCGLLSLAAMKNVSESDILDHARAVAEVIPLFGFYLQPAVGGCELSYRFWRRFAEIENLVAIKIAPFNRYQTLDVVRAVAESGRKREVALYTGNDDAILLDLLSEFCYSVSGRWETLRIVGGLLGQFAVWTRKAVQLIRDARNVVRGGGPIPRQWLKRNIEMTDVNAALFDAQNGFAGCIPGIHEILRRQGLLRGRWCLDSRVALSSGQMAEINRVCRAYPYLNDDAFVAKHLDAWLA